VTAGGVTLTENTDYTVDYNMGSVRIINQALIESQTPIQVSLESNQFFGFRQNPCGTHLDYRFSDNFNLVGTILHLLKDRIHRKLILRRTDIKHHMGFEHLL
jgi:cell surface protein SprA